MIYFKKGMCSVCLQTIPVDYSEIAAEQTAGHREIGYIGEEGTFVCIQHHFYGELCDGSGQIPQRLVKEKKC